MWKHKKQDKIDLKKLLLDLLKQESNEITDGTGNWSGVPPENRLLALRSIRSIMAHTLSALELAEGGN